MTRTADMTSPEIPDAAENTDIELWRETEGDAYAASIHVTKGGGIGINCGGLVYVKPIREWHRLASLQSPGEIPDAAVEERTPKGQARKIAWDHFQSILAEMDKSGVIVPKELAMRTDYFAALRALADDIEAALVSAALPHLAAGRAEAVAVKPLEWAHPKPHYSMWTAPSLFGEYRAWEIDDGFWWREPMAGGTSVKGGIEAAKAAAQADYEQRIRSALVPADAMAARWQTMDTAPRDGRRILLVRRIKKPPLRKRVVIGRWRARAWSMEVTANHYFSQDHDLEGWMPLPERDLEPDGFVPGEALHD